MIKEIKLPGYITIISNFIYARESTPFFCPDNNIFVPASRLSRLYMQKVPTRDQVVEIVREEALNILTSERYRCYDRNPSRSPLKSLSIDHVKKIAEGDERYLEGLKISYFNNGLIEGADYLSVFNVQVPNVYLQHSLFIL